MELKIKPYYRNNLCVIDTDEPFIQTFDCEDTYNNYFCFKAGFNLYSIFANEIHGSLLFWTPLQNRYSSF